jgi:hypothetical protein
MAEGFLECGRIKIIRRGLLFDEACVAYRMDSRLGKHSNLTDVLKENFALSKVLVVCYVKSIR